MHGLKQGATDETKAKIVRLYIEHGITARNLAARFALSHACVQQILTAAGLSRAPGGGKNNREWAS